MGMSAMLLEWAMPIEGREMKAIEEFAGGVGWFMKQKEMGKLEDVRAFGFLEGNMEERSGMLLVEGSEDQIAMLMASEEYRERIARVMTIVKGVHISRLETGDRMVKRMQRYGKALGDVLR